MTPSISSSTSTSLPSIPVTRNARSAPPRHQSPIPSTPRDADVLGVDAPTLGTVLADVMTTLANSLLMILSGTPETSTAETLDTTAPTA